MYIHLGVVDWKPRPRTPLPEETVYADLRYHQQHIGLLHHHRNMLLYMNHRTRFPLYTWRSPSSTTKQAPPIATASASGIITNKT